MGAASLRDPLETRLIHFVNGDPLETRLHFSLLCKEKLMFGSVKPSPPTVHRTVGFNLSGLHGQQKRQTSKAVCLFW